MGGETTSDVDGFSPYTVFLDQVETGVESAYLTSQEIEDAKTRFRKSAHRRFSYDREMLRLHIWQTVHFQSLCQPDFRTLYETYVRRANQSEHSIENFDELYEAYKTNRSFSSRIVLEQISIGMRVIDGTHRLAILYHENPGLFDRRNFLEPQNDHGRKVEFSTKLERILQESQHSTWSIKRGWRNPSTYEGGYHSFELFGASVVGQRRPSERLRIIMRAIDMRGSSVLDLGCNTGGMLFHQNSIGRGIGIEGDRKTFRSALKVKHLLRSIDHEFANRFDFILQDLDKLDSRDLSRLIQLHRIQVVFALSLGSWLRNWRRLYESLINEGVVLVLEINNATEGQEQLNLLRSMNATIYVLSRLSEDDRSGNHGRQSFIVLPPTLNVNSSRLHLSVDQLPQT